MTSTVSLKRALRERVRGGREALNVLWANRSARAGLVILIFYVLLVTVGPLIVPPPKVNPAQAFLPPSLKHPLGTDWLGEDILAEIVHGGGFVIGVSLIAGLFSIGLGVIIGLLAGYSDGLLSKALMGATDIALTIPGFIFTLVLVSFVKTSNPFVLAGILSVLGWAGFARAVRSQVLSIRNQPFVEAARVLGFRTGHILFREVFPNVISYTAIHYVFQVQGALLATVGLYFLGVLPYNASNWGVMLNQSQSIGAFYNVKAISYFLSPLAAVTGFALGLVLITFGLDEIFNPRLRTS